MNWRGWMTALAGLAAGAGLLLLLPEETLFTHETPEAAAPPSPSGERYACPMMDFIGTRPGDCPVCGMRMTKVTAGELTGEQQRRMGIELVRVTEGPATATVRAYGTVRYDDRTLQVVTPRVSGRVVKRHPAALHAGEVVAAGVPVVDLYSPEAFAAQAELAAAVKLADAHTIHALVERFMRWNLPAVGAAILGGGPPVDTVTVTSPYGGLVILPPEGTGMSAAKLPNVGQEVMADTPLLRLVEPRSFMISVHVPEARAHWLRAGQPVKLASDDRGELPAVKAEVAWLAPELDPAIRAREIHIHLRDPEGLLLAGSLVEARIAVALDADLRAADPGGAAPARFALIPKAAVLSTGVRHVAWKVSGRRTDGSLSFALAPLALGPRLQDEAGNDVFIVRAGLRPGDEVAAQGAFLIDSQAQLAGTPSLLFPRGADAPGR